MLKAKGRGRGERETTKIFFRNVTTLAEILREWIVTVF